MREFAGMAYQPLFDPQRIGFNVKLQGEGVLSELKRLILV